MPISTLEISGLRGFADLQTVRFAVPNGGFGSGLTILIGPNNSGKSTLVEALRALASYGEQSFPEGKRNKQAQDKVLIRITSTTGESYGLKTIEAGGSTTERIQTTIRDWRPDLYVLPSRRYFNPYFGRQHGERQGYERTAGLPQVRNEPLNQFSGRLFQALQNRPAFDRVLRQVLDPVPDWTIEQSDQGQYYLKFLTASSYHTSDGLGEGIVSLFFIIDALYDSSNTEAIVIDEPELSLHPALQKKLALLLAQYATDRQIIYATHSPYFVDFGNVVNGAEVVRVCKPASSCKIFQLTRESVEHLRGFLQNKNNPHILGLDAREALFMNDGVILLEGQEDVVGYSQLIGKLGFDAELINRIYGWGVGGADNMQTVAKVLDDLGFTKVFGIFDANRTELIPALRREFSNYRFEAIPAPDVRTKSARAATALIIGLLDENGDLREEYREKTHDLFVDVKNYLISGKT